MRRVLRVSDIGLAEQLTFGFFRNILWRNPDEPSAQPSTSRCVRLMVADKEGAECGCHSRCDAGSGHGVKETLGSGLADAP